MQNCLSGHDSYPNRKNLKIREIKPQFSIRNLENHSLILDVLAESRSGKLINIEMQTGEQENHLKRSRYHQACIDVSMLEKGTPFEKLPELYSIFITTKDFFKCGSGIYHVDRVLREGNLTIDNSIREILDKTRSILQKRKGCLCNNSILQRQPYFYILCLCDIFKLCLI